ncbi:MAG: autotransporter-associated beta strand repeat-containing protein, partial [Akkermansiaceae bacterium]|nr:autotransporter-associated beta strand repeat-containing protein [Verrucomicrobiales bacterium]
MKNQTKPNTSMPRAMTCLLLLAGLNLSALAAQKTWDGGATDSNWGSGANWGGTAPVNGDDLVFTGALRLSNSNSLVGLAVNSVSYTSPGFNHVGQTLMITNGVLDQGGNNTNGIPLIFGGVQGFTNQSGLPLVFSGTINLSNFNLTIAGGSDVLLNGVISGNGAVGVNSLNIYDGVARLGAANTFNGDVNVNSGTLRLGNAAGIPNGNSRGNLNIASGATFELSSLSPNINGLNGAGVVDQLAAGNFTLSLGNGNSNGVFSGTIQNSLGTVSLAKNGTGEQNLSGNNFFTGAVTVNGGVLRFGGANSFVGATTINGGALVLDSGASIAATNFIIAPGGLLDVSAVPGGLSFDGNLRAGRTTGFTNDVRGDITFNGGNITPVVGVAGTLTMGGNLTLNGGILNLDLSNTTTVGGGTNDLITLTNGGSLTLGGLTYVKIKPLAGTLAGGTYTVISGSATPIVGGPGNLQLAAPRGIAATFDTTTDPSSLRVTASGSSTPATVTWAGNGAGGPWDVLVSQNWLSNAVPDFFYDLDSVVFNDVAGSANATVSLPNSVTPTSITVSNSTFNYGLGVVNSDVGFIGGTGALTKDGSGHLVLNTPNNFTGLVTVNGGSLMSGFYANNNFQNQQVLFNGIAPGPVNLGNGGLYLTGQAGTPTRMILGVVSINPGGSSISSRTSRQASVNPFIDVAGIVRNGVGGTLDINSIINNGANHCGLYVTNATPLTTNGILGGWATWALNNWVVPLNTGSGSFGYAAYQVNTTPSLWGTASNINVTTTPSTITASQVINSLRLPAAVTVTVAVGQSLTLASGGLLVPNNTTGAGSITGGTLLGAAGADLIIHQHSTANSLTIGSVIADNAGASALTKAGQGTAILTTNNTYSGVTYINGATLAGNNNNNNPGASTFAMPSITPAGTLQIGSGGTSGGISNSPSVVNNGTLSFNRSDTIAYSGTISGTGGVRQQGSGTTILPLNNTYSGAITINSGTLQIGTGGASGSFSNASSVANAGALVINRTGTLAYGGTISGIGSLTLQGGANLLLNSSNTFSGATTISAGKIILGANGSLANSSPINISSGASLDASAAGGLILNGAGGGQVIAGNGGVAGAITSGGNTRLSPGGDGVIGTLTLSNALTLNGGTLTINVNAGATRDLLNVNGNLDLTSGTVALANLGGPIPNGTYKLIGYTGTLSGDIANIALSGFSQAGQLASLSSATPGQIDLVVVTGFGASLTWLGDGAGNLWDLVTSLNFTNSAGVVTNFHNNDNVSFTDAGAANATVNLAGPLAPASVLVNSTTDYTFQGAGSISGGGSLTKSGANTLTILTANNFSGPTTISAGTVNLGNGSTDGTLGGGAVTNNAALVINPLADQSLAGNISGNGTITVNGPGKVTLGGDNSGFSGSLAINAGAVQI